MVDAREVGNIDQRTVSYLEAVAQLVPTEAPDQISLFELGHELETLQATQQTVLEEWPDILAARHTSMLQAFDRTVKQFPDWKQFTQNAAETHLSPEEIEAAPEFIAQSVETFRDPDVAQIVDEEIPTALEAIILSSLEPQSFGAPDTVSEGRIIDAVESLSNALKEILGRFLDGHRAGRDGKDLIAKVGESIGKQLNKEAEDVGPNLAKALRKVLKPLLWVSGTGAGGWVLSQLSWLEPLKPFIEKLLGL